MAAPSSTTSLTVAATETRLVSVTTPFVPPLDRDCHINDLTTFQGVLELGLTASTGIVSAILSDDIDARFTSCQPSGWQAVVPESRFTFSPGVCPSQWKAISISKSSLAGNAVTRAFCCEVGYHLAAVSGLGDGNPLCIHTVFARESITIQGTLSHGTGKTQVFTQGLLAHTPWNIIWQKSDQAKMTPRPPDMEGREIISEWRFPDEAEGSSLGQSDATGLKQLGNGVFWFLVIGLPLLVIAIASCCTWCCCYNRKKKRQLNSAPAVVDVSSKDSK